MLKNSSDDRLSSVYKRYSTDFKPTSSVSPQYRKKLTNYSDLGLINNSPLFTQIRTLGNPRSSCSIKIGELISPKQRYSIITKVGIPKILADYQKSKSKEDLSENSTKSHLLKKSSQIQKFSSNYIESFCSKASPKSKTKEINPLFYKKINEVIEKSRKVVNICKKFDAKVKKIKRKSNFKLNKIDKMKIESAIKLID